MASTVDEKSRNGLRKTSGFSKSEKGKDVGQKPD
jgi:hypothetical protein